MSPRQRVIERIDALIFKYLKKERGNKCQICGLDRGNLGTFHVLPKSTYPRLRFYLSNLLLACWQPCHESWHHDYYKARTIEAKIKYLLGQDYEEDLRKVNATATRLTMVYLKTLEEAWKKELSQ